MDNANPYLPGAVGCYIFAIRNRKSIRPIYVGLSCRTCFKSEVLSPHKELLVNRALAEEDGTLLVYLLGYQTPGGKFRKQLRKSAAIGFLEDALIGACLLRNPDLLNKRQTKHLRRVVVPGFMNDAQRGRKSRGAAELAALLNR